MTASRPGVTVVVDPRRGGEPLRRTLRALSGIDGVEVIVAGGYDGADGVTPDPGALCASFNDVLGRVAHARVAVVAAGIEPTDAWVTRAVGALERSHASAVAAVVVDPDTGEPAPRPSAMAMTGHAVVPWTLVAPDGPSRTMYLGDAWVAWRQDLVAVGGCRSELGPTHLLVDLAWRLWLRGAGVVVDPVPVVAGRVDPVVVDPDALVGAERDALAMIYLYLDETHLAAVLPAAMELSRSRLAAGASGGSSPSAGVARFLADVVRLLPERRAEQAHRRRNDAEMVGVWGAPLAPDCDDPAFLARHAQLIADLPDGHRLGGRFRIVVATKDSLAPQMAGPGIRALMIARALARHHEVRLVSLSNAQLRDPGLSIERRLERDLPELVEWCDVFVFQGWVMAGQPCFHRQDRVFLVDVYDPLHFEQLEQARDGGEDERERAVRDATHALNDQLGRGDFFLCASDRQRDLWLGSLASLGRVNSVSYDDDPSLRRLLAVVPFGLPDDRPVQSRHAIKGGLAGVGPDDEVILWGGGVYNWFDPLTLVRAVDRLRQRRPGVRLVFMGMRHPNPEVPEMAMAVATRQLADELGLTGSHVIFNEDWVAFEDRHNHLLDADIAVTTHQHHVETEFAFRTRILDYLWAGLPTVATTGDALADLVEREGLGITVPPSDVEALEAALERLLDDVELRRSCQERIADVRPELAWSAVLQPVVEFCRAPRRAPDLVVGALGPMRRVDPVAAGWFHRYRAVVTGHLEAGELGELARRGIAAARRRMPIGSSRRA